MQPHTRLAVLSLAAWVLPPGHLVSAQLYTATPWDVSDKDPADPGAYTKGVVIDARSTHRFAYAPFRDRSVAMWSFDEGAAQGQRLRFEKELVWSAATGGLASVAQNTESPGYLYAVGDDGSFVTLNITDNPPTLAIVGGAAPDLRDCSSLTVANGGRAFACCHTMSKIMPNDRIGDFVVSKPNDPWPRVAGGLALPGGTTCVAVAASDRTLFVLEPRRVSRMIVRPDSDPKLVDYADLDADASALSVQGDHVYIHTVQGVQWMHIDSGGMRSRGVRNCCGSPTPARQGGPVLAWMSVLFVADVLTRRLTLLPINLDGSLAADSTQAQASASLTGIAASGSVALVSGTDGADLQMFLVAEATPAPPTRLPTPAPTPSPPTPHPATASPPTAAPAPPATAPPATPAPGTPLPAPLPPTALAAPAHPPTDTPGPPLLQPLVTLTVTAAAPTPAPTAAVVPPTVLDVTTVTSFVGSVAGATAVTTVSKLLVIQRLHCQMEDVDLQDAEPLEWNHSPFGLEVGNGRYRYYIGAVVGNVISVFCVLVLCHLYATLRRCPHVSGIIVIPSVFLMPGTLLSATRLAFFSDATKTNIVVGAFGIACVAAFPAVLYQKVLRPSVFAATVTPFRRSPLLAFLLGAVEWVPREGGAHFFEKYRACFQSYREGAAWWLMSELALLLAVGCLSAWQTERFCLIRNSCVSAAFLIFCVGTMWVQPFISRLDNIIGCANALLILLAVVLMTAALEADRSSGLAFPKLLLFASAVITTAKAVMDISFFIYALQNAATAGRFRSFLLPRRSSAALEEEEEEMAGAELSGTDASGTASVSYGRLCSSHNVSCDEGGESGFGNKSGSDEALSACRITSAVGMRALGVPSSSCLRAKPLLGGTPNTALLNTTASSIAALNNTASSMGGLLNTTTSSVGLLTTTHTHLLVPVSRSTSSLLDSAYTSSRPGTPVSCGSHYSEMLA